MHVVKTVEKKLYNFEIRVQIKSNTEGNAKA